MIKMAERDHVPQSPEAMAGSGVAGVCSRDSGGSRHGMIQVGSNPAPLTQGLPADRVFLNRKLPYPEVFGPLRHIVALAADIGRPTMMVAADLFHEECDL
jgi:hypothetical protein